MPERYLNQPGFTYNACGLFTKNQEGIQKFKETGDTKYIYRNGLDKTCFQHDVAHGDFKELTRRTASNKVLVLLKIQNMMDIKEVLVLWFIIFLVKCPLHLQINLLNVVVLIMKLNKIRNWLKNYTKQLLKNFKKEEFILNLQTISGVLI